MRLISEKLHQRVSHGRVVVDSEAGSAENLLDACSQLTETRQLDHQPNLDALVQTTGTGTVPSHYLFQGTVHTQISIQKVIKLYTDS